MANNTFVSEYPVPHPSGRPMDVADYLSAGLPLPDDGNIRWTASRKAQVLECIRAEVLSIEQACECYSISKDEMSTWKGYYDDHEVAGLRAKEIRNNRSLSDMAGSTDSADNAVLPPNTAYSF